MPCNLKFKGSPMHVRSKNMKVLQCEKDQLDNSTPDRIKISLSKDRCSMTSTEFHRGYFKETVAMYILKVCIQHFLYSE